MPKLQKSKGKIKSYMWFKSRLQQGIEPFITIPDKVNFVGEIIGLNPVFKEDLMRKLLRIFFVNNIIYLSDSHPWLSMAFDTSQLIPEVKVKVDTEGLFKEVIDRNYDKSGVGLNIVRHSDYCTGMPMTTNLTALSSRMKGVDKYGFLLKPFIMSVNDVDWMVRAQRLWLRQAKKYNIVKDKRPFLINVVGGPKIWTSFSKDTHGEYFDNGRIKIWLSTRLKTLNSMLEEWTWMLVHEFTHFLQYMFVRVNPDLKSSWTKVVSMNNVKKYYSRMWERDAYAIQFLWLYLHKQNLPLSALANAEVLRLHFNPDSFKAFLKSNYDVKWHIRRMNDDKMGEQWINGLVVSAQKFVGDMQPAEAYREQSSCDWTLLPYKYSIEDIGNNYRGNKNDYCWAVNAEYYRYAPFSTKLPEIMSRVNLYVE